MFRSENSEVVFLGVNTFPNNSLWKKSAQKFQQAEQNQEMLSQKTLGPRGGNYEQFYINKKANTNLLRIHHFRRSRYALFTTATPF